MEKDSGVDNGIYPQEKIIIENSPPKSTSNYNENSQTGYIKIYRSLQQHWIWQDAKRFQWWTSILMNVNHKEKDVLINGITINCKRGQCIKSIGTWSKFWKINESKVRRFFSLLESHGMIKVEGLSKTTRITICNYEDYQGDRRTDEEQAKNKRRTKGEQTKTNKNDKKGNNDNNDKKIQMPFDGDDFILAWDKYKVHRKELCNSNMSKLTEEKQLDKLKEISESKEQAIQIIDNCIFQSWKNIYPINKQTKSNGKNNRPEPKHGITAEEYTSGLRG